MTIKEWQRKVFLNSQGKGFWDAHIVGAPPLGDNARKQPVYDTKCIPEKLCLVHEEISEALGHYRDGKLAYFETPSKIGPKPDGFGIELADAVIRIMDLAEATGIDLESLIALKHDYNTKRPHMHGRTC